MQQITTNFTKGRLELFLVSSCLSSFSTSTQQINFHHAKRRQCSKAGLSTPPWVGHCRTRDLSRHTEKSHLPPVPYLLPELWLADPPVVCVTFNKIILPRGLLEATKRGSTNHAFPSWWVCVPHQGVCWTAGGDQFPLMNVHMSRYSFIPQDGQNR